MPSTRRQLIQNANRRNALPDNAPPQRPVSSIAVWALSNAVKLTLYGLASLLGVALGASLGLGLMYTAAVALAVPIAMEATSRVSNFFLNFIFPSRFPRRSSDAFNAFIMTSAFFFTLGISAIFGLSLSIMAGIVFLAPLVIDGSWSILSRIISRLIPSLGALRIELEDGVINLSREAFLTNVRTNNNIYALVMLARENYTTETLMTAAEEAIIHNNTQVFNEIVARPQVSAQLNRENNRMLIRACFEGRTEMVNTLLSHESVRNTASINNNEALRYACREGYLDIVEALLQIRQVRDGAAYNNCEARRLALDTNHPEIAQRLLQIRAVANHIDPPGEVLTITLRQGPPQLVDPNALRNLAQQRENSMAALTPEQVQALAQMRTRYQATLTERTRAGVLGDIRRYLVEEYNRKPVIYNNRRLPLEYDASLSNAENRAYHTHKIHTAYRCLFTNHNSWGGRAYISDANYEILCYNWLAANDDTRALPQGFTRPRIRKLFADMIYQAQRAHNWDQSRTGSNGAPEQYDDGAIDSPTCGAGVQQRFMQFNTMFLNDNPQTRPISAAIVKEKFKEELITESDNKQNMFRKLTALSKKDLNDLDESYGEWSMECDSEKLPTEMRKIKLPTAAVDGFIEQCKTYFGAERFENTGQNITHNGKHFNTYELYVRELARNMFNEFGAEITGKIQALKNPKTKASAADKGKSKDKDNAKSKTLTFSAKSKAPSKSKTDKENTAPKNAKKSNVYHPRPKATRV